MIEATCVPNPFGAESTLSGDATALAITAGLSVGSWERMAAWLRKFLQFLELTGRRTPGRPTNILHDNTVVIEFLVNVTNEKPSKID